MKRLSILFLYVFLCRLTYNAQNTDSLKLVLRSLKEDTTKLKVLNLLVENIADDRVWPLYNTEAYKLSEKLMQDENEIVRKKGKKGFADATQNLGFTCELKGKILDALGNYERGLKLQEELGDKGGIANALNSIGNIYSQQGNITKALGCYNRSLNLFEEIGDKQGTAFSLNSLGLLYTAQGEETRALLNGSKSIKLFEEIGDKNGLAQSLNNIGIVYNKKGDTQKALEYYNKSLKIEEELNNWSHMAVLLNNIGMIYDRQKNYSKALEYYFKNLKISEEIKNKNSMSMALTGIGAVYYKLGAQSGSLAEKNNKYLLASKYSDTALFLSKELGFPRSLRNSELVRSKIDSARGNYLMAYEHYKQFIIYRDSLSNEETRKASIRSQLRYDYEKKEAETKADFKREQAIAEEQNQRQKFIIWSGTAGTLLIILFAFFAVRSLRMTRKQKIIIEEKQKEIVASIHYAKRIQQTLIPSEKYLEKELKRLKKE
jgi:tetratricopeptide (TPR) repeat protein